jgi:hypothetical protein
VASGIWWYEVVGNGIELNKTGIKGVKIEKSRRDGS